MTFENLLNTFIDKARLKRAQRIRDKELVLQELTDNRVKALIRDCHIVIDLRNRMVLHDCQTRAEYCQASGSANT